MKTFAAEAHQPMPVGEIYDRALLEKDRNYFDNLAQPKAKKKKGKE